MEESVKFRYPKGDNSYITNDTIMELHVHNYTMVIIFSISFIKFHPVGYLAMAEEGKHLNLGTQRAITPLLLTTPL